MKHKLLFKNYLKTFFLLAFISVGNFGFGQIVAFNNAWSGTTTTANATTTDPNLSTVSLSRGSGITASSSSSRISSTNFASGATLTLANNDYYTFILTANSGYFINLNSSTLSISLGSSGTGPQSYGIYSNVGGFTSTANQIGSNLGAATSQTINFPSSGYSSLSSIEIRIYGWNASATTGTGGIASLSLTGTVSQPAITWNGSTNNNFSIATNWTPNTVPTGAEDVSIPSGNPILDQDFTIATGKTLTVSGSGTLTVNPTRTLTIAGTAAFNDRPIALKSDNTGTASIGQVTGSLTGATNVTVERYIAGRRAFRFLTPSVTTTTSIFANWQNAGLSTAGIGTQITGSTTGANGFDLTVSGNPSLATYNAQIAAGTGFVNASNTDVATLAAGVGYRVLVRGDRNVDLTATSADNMNVPTTLSAKGTLTTGAVSFTNSAGPVLVNNQSGNGQTNGYTLIGNPYASPVDWNAVTKTGVANNAYYTWDPTLGTAAQRGRYVVYSADSGLTNLYDDNSVLSQTNRRYLQTGQAVFIKNTVLATSATLTFNEANKTSVNSFVFRTNEQAVTVTGSSSLYLTVFDSNELAIGAAPIDGSVALFGASYNNALDANDVDKLTTSGENLAFVRESKNLAIETLAPVVANDELFVKTVQFQANKNYTFKVNTANFDTAVTAKMVDLYLNTETAIDLTQPSFVTFATTADATSYGADRFKIVFNNAALGNGSFNASAVAIYPNPIANNEFTIALPNSVSGNVTVKMSNMLGQEVYSRTSEATTTMQIHPKQQLEEGVYVVSISNNGQVIQAKVIVKN